MELSPNIPEQIKELIKMMWHTDCTQRLMFPDVITTLRERLYDFMSALDRMRKPRPSQKNSLKQKSNSKSEYAFASSPSSSAVKAPITNDSKAAIRNPNDIYSTDSYCEELSSDEDVSEYGLVRVNSGTSLLKFGVPDFGLRIED